MSFLSLICPFEAFVFLNYFWGNVCKMCLLASLCLSKCNSPGTTKHIFMTYAIKPTNAHV